MFIDTSLIKSYISLTKPGIIFGNLIAAAAGFFLASKGNAHFFLFLATMVGLGLVIASACVVNNYLDRGIDGRMARTKKRVLVKKVIPAQNALLFAIILGFVGFLILIRYTNLLTAFVAFVGFFFYVVVYSIGKRKTEYGTILGSISGAMPPVVGYCAVVNRIDIGALLLFFILVFWQMPHFYAIALFRLEDYAAAHIPVLPLTKGFFVTRLHMLLYIIAFSITAVLLFVFKLSGPVYLFVTIAASIGWLVLSMKGFWIKESKKWGRMMFRVSLIVLLLVCLFMSLDR